MQARQALEAEEARSEVLKRAARAEELAHTLQTELYALTSDGLKVRRHFLSSYSLKLWRIDAGYRMDSLTECPRWSQVREEVDAERANCARVLLEKRKLEAELKAMRSLSLNPNPKRERSKP